MSKLLLSALCVVAFTATAEQTTEAAPYRVFVVSQTCQANGTVSLTFDWWGSDPASPEMWVGASLVNDGAWYPWRDWAIGPYTFYSPLPTWHGFPQGVRHYIHIGELRWWGQWEMSPIIAVDARTCPGPDCHPSYPTVYIPSPPPDLDCPQIGYRNFRVVGSDPHRFDGDRDGIGCET